METDRITVIVRSGHGKHCLTTTDGEYLGRVSRLGAFEKALVCKRFGANRATTVVDWVVV
jgi:hypothetical protein